MFDWFEYLVFSTMLLSSILIGVYYGCVKKENTAQEYLQGGKKMAVFPIAMSLIASHVSGISLLGLPAEVYTYGTQFLASALSVILATIFILWISLPVFLKLDLTTSYQYLELRFSHGNRVLASLMFTLSLVFMIPIVIYIPSLAFNQVTGVESYWMTPFVCAVCIFYTTFGGMKAVVWTDTVQSTFTMIAVVFITIIGVNNQGFLEILRISQEGHRIEWFNMDPNPFARTTFWTTVLGFYFFWLGIVAFHPGSIQRFTAVPTFRETKLVIIWSTLGFLFIKFFCGFVGLLLYSLFYDCDPLASNAIKRSGQIVPYYIMIAGGNYPGILGLFISGIVNSALGAMSAGLNTAAGSLYQDLIQVLLKGTKKSDNQATYIMKAIVLILGGVCVLLLFIVDKFDSLTQITLSMVGTTYGAISSMFLLGLFFPWANAKGAMIGGTTSLVLMCWIVLGAQLSIAQGSLKFPGKVTSIDNCPYNFTVTNTTAPVQTYTGVGSLVVADDSVLLIYQISYGYYCMMGTIVGIVVGIIASLLTEPQDLSRLDPELLAPVVRRFLPKSADTEAVRQQESKLIHFKSESVDRLSKNHQVSSFSD